MKNIHWLMLDSFMLGLWVLSIALTMQGIFKFSYLLFGSIFSLGAFLIHYKLVIEGCI